MRKNLDDFFVMCLEHGVNKVEYQEIEWAEMKPDVYAGKKCNEHEPRFEVSAEGDMQSGTTDKLEYFANLLPAGSKIIVSVPCCPNDFCGIGADQAIDNVCECGFHWKNWTEEQYS